MKIYLLGLSTGIGSRVDNELLTLPAFPVKKEFWGAVSPVLLLSIKPFKPSLCGFLIGIKSGFVIASKCKAQGSTFR